MIDSRAAAIRLAGRRRLQLLPGEIYSLVFLPIACAFWSKTLLEFLHTWHAYPVALPTFLQITVGLYHCCTVVFEGGEPVRCMQCLLGRHAVAGSQTNPCNAPRVLTASPACLPPSWLASRARVRISCLCSGLVLLGCCCLVVLAAGSCLDWPPKGLAVTQRPSVATHAKLQKDLSTENAWQVKTACKRQSIGRRHLMGLVEGDALLANFLRRFVWQGSMEGIEDSDIWGAASRRPSK